MADKRVFPTTPPPPAPSKSPRPNLANSSHKPLPIPGQQQQTKQQNPNVNRPPPTSTNTTTTTTATTSSGMPPPLRKMTSPPPTNSTSSLSQRSTARPTAEEEHTKVVQKKTLPQLLQMLSDTESQFNSMKVFLGELTTLVTKQLVHAQAQTEEGMKVAHLVMEFSFNFFTGDLDQKTTELGHCTTMMGSLIQAVHGIMEPKLKTGILKMLNTFNQLHKSFQTHSELRATVAELKNRMEELNERLQNLQKRGKVDLVKLSELQQERDSVTAKCRKTAEETAIVYESLRDGFLWQCLEEFSEYATTYQQFFQSGVEFAESFKPKTESWRSQATVIKSEQKEKATQMVNEGKVTMSNGMLQLFANTEQQFIERLKLLTQTVMGSVLKDGSLFTDMSREDVSAIFGSAPPLLDFHQALFKRLVSSQNVSTTFAEKHLVEMFQSYTRYLENYVASQEALFACRKKSKAFRHLLKALQKDLQKETLDSLLDAPIDRMHEYLTFLEGLSSQTTKITNEESQHLLRVVEVVRELDSGGSQVKSQTKLQQVCKLVDGWNEGETTQPPDRRYISEVPISLPQAQAQLFVLNDILLIAKKPNALLQGFKKHFQFVLSMKIANTTPRELGPENPHGFKNGLELVDSHQNITLPIEFETEEQRNSTCSRIKTLRDELAENKVFGVDLATLMNSKKEKGRDVPTFLEDICEAIIQTSLDLEGIFRISASAKEMEEIRARVDSGQQVPFTNYNGHAIGGALKLWIRSLPEPLLTFNLFDEFSNTVKGKSNVEDAIRSVSIAINKLPRVNKATVNRLITFLSLIDKHSANNKMNAKNLAIVFAPQLLRNRKTVSTLNLTDMGMNNSTFDCVLFMIEHSSEIFGEYIRKTQSQQSKRMAMTMARPSDTPPSITDLEIPRSEEDGQSPSSELTLSLRDIIKQGNLQKLRGNNTSWDQRWVILKKGYLYHFKNQKDTKGGVFPLQGAKVQEMPSNSFANSQSSGITSSNQKQQHLFCFSVHSAVATSDSPQEIVFSAKTQEEATAWINAINACIPV